MNIEITKGLVLCFAIPFTLLMAGSDTLIYPELANAAAIEDMAEGESSLKISCEERMGFRTKAQFIYRGFKFNYKNHGGEDEEIDQQTSMAFSGKSLSLAVGHGQPHLAHGLILGNTMMRYSPAFSGQAGLRPGKIRTGAYEQYKKLMVLGYQMERVSMSLFYYNDIPCAVLELHDEDQIAGLACYAAETMMIETWATYKDDHWTTGFSNSFANGKFNHFMGEMLYGKAAVKLFAATAWVSKEFNAIKSDSKWGSGLMPGSRGFALGFNFGQTPCKLSGMAYDIHGTHRKESRYTAEFRFKKTPFEITGAFLYKKIDQLCESEQYPFGQIWLSKTDQGLKMNLKLKISSTLILVCQAQGDVLHKRSHVSLLRLTYAEKGHKLKLQITHCCGFENDLYFIRPSGNIHYGIRKAPANETLYLDLICSKKIDSFDVYIHLRNEGVSLGINYE